MEVNILPSQKVLSEKQQFVSDLAAKLKTAKAGVIVDYKGISVADDTQLRRDLRAEKVEYFVVKNTLLKLAAKEAGIDGLDSFLEGTTALAISTDDQIAPAKVLGKYDEKMKEIFNVKAGFMDGEVLDAKKVIALGKLPSKEQLVGQLLSVMIAPIRGLAVALNAVAEQDNA